MILGFHTKENLPATNEASDWPAATNIFAILSGNCITALAVPCAATGACAAAERADMSIAADIIRLRITGSYNE